MSSMCNYNLFVLLLSIVWRPKYFYQSINFEEGIIGVVCTIYQYIRPRCGSELVVKVGMVFVLDIGDAVTVVVGVVDVQDPVVVVIIVIDIRYAITIAVSVFVGMVRDAITIVIHVVIVIDTVIVPM